jgi:hypothetical protein
MPFERMIAPKSKLLLHLRGCRRIFEQLPILGAVSPLRATKTAFLTSAI